MSSECCIILIFKKEHNNYTFRSICTWLGPHPHRTAVLRVASPAGPGQSSLLPPWPVCGCAAPWLTWASRFQLFSDSSGAQCGQRERAHMASSKMLRSLPTRCDTGSGMECPAPVAACSLPEDVLSPLQSYRHLALD